MLDFAILFVSVLVFYDAWVVPNEYFQRCDYSTPTPTQKPLRYLGLSTREVNVRRCGCVFLWLMGSRYQTSRRGHLPLELASGSVQHTAKLDTIMAGGTTGT